MEEFDEEMFARGPRGPSPATLGITAGQWRRGSAPVTSAARRLEVAEPEQHAEGARRREERIRCAGGRSRVRVTGLGPDGRAAVQEELQLLGALRTAGLGAVPEVGEALEDGYEREDATPLRRGGGRRSAEGGDPPTGERMALARARSDLEALLDVLHGRGLVLGASPGEGLGVRADGSVVVSALAGLRRAEGVGARQADRRWVDSVLGDQERTLRRRIDTPHRLWEPEPVPGKAEPTAPPASAGAPSVASAPAPSLPAPRTRSRRQDRTGSAQAVPTDEAGRNRQRSPADVHRAWSTVRGVLAEPRNRRTALLSGLAALVLGGLIAGGMWWSASPVGTPTTAASPSTAGEGAKDSSAQEEPAVQIADPWALAAELAGARHAYVTGLSQVPPATAGSEAYAADLEVREAYAGLEVRGGGPVVHEAELVEGRTEDGEAVLRAVVSTPAHELVRGDGTVRDVPATAPAALTLTLRWDGEQWRIQQVREQRAAGDGAG